MKSSLKWREKPACFRRYVDLDLPVGASFIYRNNNNMVPTFQGPNAASVIGYDAFWESQDVVVVGDCASGRYVLIGAVTAFRSLSFFHVEKRGRIVGVEMWQPSIAAGETPEETVILEGCDWRKLLIEYARTVAEKMNVAPIADDVKNYCGYCSWYYYYAGVTEQDLRENIDLLTAKLDKFPTRVVQIDDGYQTFQGDWLDQRDAWPTPLAEVAAEIEKRGMIPGIWTMPLIASTASRIFHEHPDWFVQNQAGEPFIFPGWSPPPDNEWVCLDATRPEVEAHLTNVFKTLRSRGFRYFKMDALGFCMPEGKRFDPAATPVSAYRRGLAAVKAAAPDAVFLGCGAPFMASLGLIDHCRVSQDTLAVWQPGGKSRNAECCSAEICVANAWHTTAGNWWMFDRYFRADPDVVIVRQNKSELTIGEARISAMGGIISGVVITSDNFEHVDPDRFELLARSAKLRLHKPVPEKWNPDLWPFAFSGTVDGRQGLALINDTPEEKTFDLSEYGLSGECEEVLQPIGKIGKVMTLASHDAALVVAL